MSLDAPLLAAWSRFVAAEPRPFTVPGHKRRGASISAELGELLAGDVPLFGGVGTIKDAATDLGRAEDLGARLWQADWCRYSSGGSTHTNQAVALAVGRPGDTVLVTRTAHRSTLLGITLAGLRPVWLPSDLDERFGLPAGLSAATLRTALDAHPDAVAVFCVEPSYVGTVSDLAALIEVAHARDVPVVVDQAWGAHFGFHPAYPAHALQLGADAMVTSAHKTLPAYSQASLLAARTERLDRDRLERAFEASATTSPSGTILASVDAARAVLAAPLGGQLLDRLAGIAATARERLRRELPGLRAPGPEDFPAGRFDPAKLVLLLAATGLSGNELEAGLITAGLPTEQADRDTLIPIVTLLDDESTLGAYCDELIRLAATAGRQSRPAQASSVWTQAIPPAAATPRAAFFARHETVPGEDAVGRTSAELIAPYPPGIPVLVPGEQITPDTLTALRAAAATGIRIAYAADPSLATFQVVARE